MINRWWSPRHALCPVERYALGVSSDFEATNQSRTPGRENWQEMQASAGRNQLLENESSSLRCSRRQRPLRRPSRALSPSRTGTRGQSAQGHRPVFTPNIAYNVPVMNDNRASDTEDSSISTRKCCKWLSLRNTVGACGSTQ